MVFVNSLLAAFSTYSVIPVPRFKWDERACAYALCFFPAVGLVCGGLLALWNVVCTAAGAGSALFSAVAVCLPILLTGGIHMDGYMDTVDAISSHQPRERRLEILKDSRCGAFAVVYCGVFLLLSFGLFSALYAAKAVFAVCPGYVLSRALSSLCAVILPGARKDGMLRSFTSQADRRATVIAAGVTGAAAAAVMVVISPLPGLVAFAAAVLTMVAYSVSALRLFGGVTGDTAGFFLQLCELSVLAGAWIGGLF